MKAINLIWIIPLVLITGVVLGFISGASIIIPENITMGYDQSVIDLTEGMKEFASENRAVCNFNITPDMYKFMREDYHRNRLHSDTRIIETFCKKPEQVGKLHLIDTRELIYLELNEPFEMYGWTFEVIGGDYEPENTVIIDINGNRKTLKEGESLTNGDVTIYAESLFLTSIPYLTASGNFRIYENQEGTIR